MLNFFMPVELSVMGRLSVQLEVICYDANLMDITISSFLGRRLVLPDGTGSFGRRRS
jgi:hypothetical protein